MKANPFARPVSRSLARNTLVTRPKRSNISRRSFSSANSETCAARRGQYFSSIDQVILGCPYICNPQCSEVVSLILTTHPLSPRCSLGSTSQMRGYVSPSASAQPACLVFGSIISIHASCSCAATCRSVFSHRRHGVFEWAASREMLSITYPALDLHVLKLFLGIVLLRLLLFAILLPGDTRPENDVLAD